MKLKKPTTSSTAAFWLVVWVLFSLVLPGQGFSNGIIVGNIGFFLFACFGIAAFVESRKN